MIKWILDICSSKCDTNGNRYHVAQLTSTRTGRSVWFRTYSEGNARHAVTQAAGYRFASEFLHCTEQELPIRKFNELEKRTAALNESDITATLLTSMEGRKRKNRRLYVGCKAGAPWEVFRADEKPTHNSHGAQYAAVIGPFRTKTGAEFMRDYGENNPHCRCVADAERLAKLSLTLTEILER